MGAYTKSSVIQSRKFLSKAKHSEACIRPFAGKEYPDIRIRLVNRDGFKVFYFATNESVQCIKQYHDCQRYYICFNSTGYIFCKEVGLGGTLEFLRDEESKKMISLPDVTRSDYYILKLTAHTCSYRSRFARFPMTNSFFPIEVMDLV